MWHACLGNQNINFGILMVDKNNPEVLGVLAKTSANHVSGLHLYLLVGRARFELATNGLKVRCSTD
jgi:hypothetical protein